MTTRLFAILLMLATAGAANADTDSGRYSGVTLIRGTVISAGRVDPTEDIDTGFFVDANYSSVAVNAGVATKKFGESPLRPEQRSDAQSEANDERVNNVYAGIGFGRIVQIQYGYGNHKDLLRFRSDFNFRSVVDFLSGHHTPKDRMTLGDRLTFTIAAERYLDGDEDIFNNTTWGIGLLF
ncbi:hypothetical protein A11A3_01330 [Alcanivorax hongdengensis A-11-3]|uniref:Outer membrane protein beta-barrel domain-containing protein n=1 Tax=Alcanivorax hongdengensis A-11-3 TaxID=1177179 RepID=L0WH96_9GAMM|nr:hypothetical protein [Alcanivorax hongdengensis]EKF76094.1 hypothetical protein A11A3_01330 [Alcanivorax hongdengensis A-11-3]